MARKNNSGYRPAQVPYNPQQRRGTWPVASAPPPPAASVPPPAQPPPNAVKFECSICFERLDAPAGTVPQPGKAADPAKIVATRCGHMYHAVCLDEWLETKGQETCPACREYVDYDDEEYEPIELFPTESASSSKIGSSAASKDLYETLKKDYDDLKTQFEEIKDKNTIDQVRIQSLMDEDERKERKIKSLKRRLRNAEKDANANEDDEQDGEVAPYQGASKPKKKAI